MSHIHPSAKKNSMKRQGTNAGKGVGAFCSLNDKTTASLHVFTSGPQHADTNPQSLDRFNFIHRCHNTDKNRSSPVCARQSTDYQCRYKNKLKQMRHQNELSLKRFAILVLSNPTCLDQITWPTHEVNARPVLKQCGLTQRGRILHVQHVEGFLARCSTKVFFVACTPGGIK